MGKASIPQYTTLAASAAAFAVRAHEGQYRTGTQFPYVVHPIGVAHILREYYGDETLEAAGYLHDVVEDTDHTIMTVIALCGERVAELVAAVTKTHGVPYDLALYAGDQDVLRLKAADMVDNITETIRGLEKGHDVWSRFSAGKGKADTWRRQADIIFAGLPGEDLAARLDNLVATVEGMR